MMEIVKFEDNTWQEIPDQDNPTYHKDGYGARYEECIIICKDGRERVNKDSYLVIHVPLEGDIIQKGCFWHMVDAELFAIALSHYEKVEV